ncbi:hypothetical protein [Nannocystis sp. SCPEA4]|uniref:hypothetical protein n=1 Tax=Nannocystis sp. SCPEA4 TaxID=2996787 RepID=UPI00226F91D3|nr:hypothetical protein [Nannocystis sp. SCPEA4]MCY1059326.1 hypothetical protein [Nannocystis sp. SCPEA4]
MLLFLAARTASAQPPPNDNFANATVVPGLPYTDTEDTVDATREAGEPQPTCVTNSHTVWYSFTPDADVSVDANTVGSDYDTTLTVYTGTFPSLTEIACNDDIDPSINVQSALTFSATAGETYYIQVGSFEPLFGGGTGGNLVFNLEQTQITLDITLDPNATVTSAGVATVSGTVFCSSSTTVDVSGTVEQKVKGSLISVGYDTQVSCEAGPGGTAWSAVTDEGGLKAGNATLSASASAAGASEVEDSRSIKLKRVR